MLIMDVGSTKATWCRPPGARCATSWALRAGHPITGREVSGVEHADAELYSGRQVILTPIERTLTAQLQKGQEVWTALGCRVTSMSPESHDAAFAAVSHLPHLLAFALMNSITGQSRAMIFCRWPARVSRLHPHRGGRPQDVARHPAVQPRRAAGPVALSSRRCTPLSRPWKRQRPATGRHAHPGQRNPRPLAHGRKTQVTP
jgi:hypothetical protein